jgi:hypothetical protein
MNNYWRALNPVWCFDPYTYICNERLPGRTKIRPLAGAAHVDLGPFYPQRAVATAARVPPIFRNERTSASNETD